MSLLSYPSPSNSIHHFPNPSPAIPLFHRHRHQFFQVQGIRFSITLSTTSGHRNRTQCLLSGKSQEGLSFPKLPPELVRVLAASVIIFLGLGIRTCSAAASTQISPILAADCQPLAQPQTIQGNIIIAYMYIVCIW